MKNVINCTDKQDAINQAARFLAYFPFRHAAIVDMHGQWGYVTGKTMRQINDVVRAGFPAFLVKRGGTHE